MESALAFTSASVTVVPYASQLFHPIGGRAAGSSAPLERPARTREAIAARARIEFVALFSHEARASSDAPDAPYRISSLSRFHASSRALTFAACVGALLVGSSPSRMNPWPAPS